MKVEDFVPSTKQSDYVLIKVKNYGDIVAVLRSDVAPITVANFKKLTSEKFFDGTVFHRVIENFMIQGGGCIVVKDDKGVDTFKAKESPTIKGEFDSNGFTNNLYYVRGVLAMARTNVKDSASSQFYIVHKSNESSANLNGEYATFGYVLAGMDVVDAIATCKTFGDANAPIPIEDVVIESVTFVEPK
ncbi:MAG: peptidylprolyl isomerase [Clostridia bacterium]|nr:peptidylprolyl isomerase [Clostridia bacterium]